LLPLCTATASGARSGQVQQHGSLFVNASAILLDYKKSAWSCN
jgi:hypothetical protein